MPNKTIDKIIEEFEKLPDEHLRGATSTKQLIAVKDFLRSSLTEYRKSIEEDLKNKKQVEDVFNYGYKAAKKEVLGEITEKFKKMVKNKGLGSHSGVYRDGFKDCEKSVLNIIDTKE